MTVHSLAQDLGVDVDDVRVVLAWLTDAEVPEGRLDAELEHELIGVLDAGGDRTSACIGCGRRYAGGQVLVGWAPCNCGGHRTVYCRDDDVDGCGETRYSPPRDEDTCRSPGFGFSR